MTISEQFDNQAWAKRLGRRATNFKTMLEHVNRFDKAVIVETGTAWHRDNFEGQGQSTLIWDWATSVHKNLEVTSIDIRQEAVDTAASQTKNVKYICSDSVLALNCFPTPHLIDLLYLDSCDWTPERNLESAFHHLAELAAVWALLPHKCMIVVDDRHGDLKGKHWMVEAFMNHVKAELIFKNHQIGFIKP